MASAAQAGGGWTPSRSVAGPYSPWLIIAIISLPTFMEVLDTSIANVSLDHIAGGLSISTDQATWVLTSYLVANAIIIPISGWLSDVIGRKRYFLMSIALFTLSSLMCGIAPNLSTLVIARVAQGIGGGGLAPVEQSMLADTFPPKQRGMAFAAFAIVVVVGPVLGPTLGGYITETSSWHWVFLINVPVGVIAFFLTDIFVDEPEAVREDRRKLLAAGRLRIDYVGVILVALGLGFLEITFDRGEREDWFSSGFIVMTATIAAVSLLSLVVWELNVKDPVIDLKLFKNRNFAITNLIMGLTGLVLFGTTQLVPQMLQQVLGYSSFDAGLALTFGGFATLVAVPFAGRLSGKVDVRLLIVPALLIQAFALWYMSHLNAEITFTQAAVARLYSAAGLPFLFVPINTVAYAGLPQNKTAQASSLLNVSRNLGGSIGIASAQTLLSSALQRRQAELVNYANPLNPNYTDWVQHAGSALGGDQTTTLAVVFQTIQRQAAMLAFLDVFRTLMIVVLVVTPLALLMRSGKQKGGGGGGMMH